MPSCQQLRIMSRFARIRGLALVMAALFLAVPVVANAAEPSPRASQRIVADAQLRFPMAHHKYVLMDLHAAGPTTGYPAEPGYVDVGLRLCASSGCNAPATYRQSLTAGQFTAAQDASVASLAASIMGVPLKLTWSSEGDYRTQPTLVLNRGAVTGAAGGYVVVPADRYAEASGLANKRSCRARQASLSYQAVVGTPAPDTFTKAPGRLPSRFWAIQRSTCG